MRGLSIRVVAGADGFSAEMTVLHSMYPSDVTSLSWHEDVVLVVEHVTRHVTG
jgi:hypothetical protein